MKYEIGDKVVIKEGLIVENMYGGCFIQSEMARLGGQIATIKSTFVVNGDHAYHIDLDYGNWSWTSEMFKKRQTLTPESIYSEYIKR